MESASNQILQTKNTPQILFCVSHWLAEPTDMSIKCYLTLLLSFAWVRTSANTLTCSTRVFSEPDWYLAVLFGPSSDIFLVETGTQIYDNDSEAFSWVWIFTEPCPLCTPIYNNGSEPLPADLPPYCSRGVWVLEWPQELAWGLHVRTWWAGPLPMKPSWAEPKRAMWVQPPVGSPHV